MAVGVQVVEPVLWKYIPFGGAFTSCNFFISLALTAGTISALCTPVKGSSPQQANRSLLTSALFISIPFIVALYSKSQAPCRTPPLPTTYYGTYRPPMANTSNLMMTGYRLGLLSPPTTLSNGTEPAVRNSTVNLLARTDSVTGTIVVAEFVEEGIRYLRADHSLLGGRWIGERAYGEYLGDSIYGTFTQQEAVRMVKRESIRDGENALVIGLGVGIAAEALIKHGNKVHIVEIDPAVYTYARGFFNLSEPYAVHLTDARQWVHEQYTTLQSMPAVLFPDMATNEDSKRTHSSDTEANRFGMVIHDCFSGGGVPSHLFSLEFWEDLKGIMTPDGVVAVNFAGHIGTPAARAIWFTLEKAFGTENRGRGCRVFHDRLEQPGEEHTTQEDEFMNMIYFCQKDEGIPSAQSSEKKKVEFRRANDRDYLKSWLRYAMLSSMLDREVTMERITGLTPENEGNVDGSEWILTDKNNRLAEWQHHSAIEHWGVMREVMPYSVWEVY
ncbi:hypothetical protein FRC17_000127 [Serendipita sp. 399]|nr:hypothetical protein FRC17_000127 [Serendipita sp. 399]